MLRIIALLEHVAALERIAPSFQSRAPAIYWNTSPRWNELRGRAAQPARSAAPNDGNDIQSARQEGTPRRNRPANREICPVARPEHATGEFIPVDGKNATERALDGLCISSMDVSLFAGHLKRDAEDGACNSFPLLEIVQDGQKRPPSATGGTNEKQNSPVIRQNCPVDSAERETRTSLPMSNPNGLRSENKPVPYFPRRAPRPPSAQLPRNPR